MPVPAKTNGLLSLAYLLRHLKPSDALASTSDVVAAYELTCSLYRKHASALRNQNEAFRRDGTAYLRPSAQGFLLTGPGDCLEVIEKAVNWEAGKLYGVQGLGPFDEF